MNKKYSIKKTLILVAILALPGFLYYLLQEKGKNRYKPLGIFGPKKITGTYHTLRGKRIPDTLYHKIGNISLIDEKGDSVLLFPDTNTIVIADFFYSRCKGSCELTNEAMERLSDKYRSNQRLKFRSLTVDPEFDRPEVLQKYSKQFVDKSANWSFLSGQQAQIHEIARSGFLVDAFEDTTKAANFVHSPMLILLDPQRRIRGYYDAQDKGQISKLDDEIKVLITEVLRNDRHRKGNI